MKLFMIKKTFFDMWDNLLKIVILNLGFILVSAIFLIVPYLHKFNIIWGLLGFFLSFIIFNIYYGTVSLFVLKIADYESAGFNDFFLYFKKSWKISILYSLSLILFMTIIIFVIPFYSRLNNYLGFFISFLFLWGTLIFFLSIQYFYQIYGRFNNSFFKVIKKCLLVLFDNTGFSIYLVFVGIIIIILSLITGFIFPGISTFLLWQSVGLKLRLYKYDYLEENPDANRKKIPWDILLENDKEMVGKRTLKGMIFPWKE